MKKIPKDQVADRLRSENFWWNKPNRISGRLDDYKRRPYLDVFYPHILERNVTRAVILMGPRRIGKTVLIHHAVQKLIDEGVDPKKICYISVDHPLYNGLILEDFLGSYMEATGVDYKRDECFIFFDEIQYLKNWENNLKILVDDYNNIKFIASGSAAAALRLSSMESGAGRFTDFFLPPLTFYEYMTLIDKSQLVLVEKSDDGFVNYSSTGSIAELNENFVRYLNFGGYPEAALSKEIQDNPGQFIKSDIIDKVLLRDLPSLYGVNDIQELNYLFTTLAFNTSNEVSLQELSKSSGVAKNTIKRYIEYLEAAFLIKVVHRIERSGRRFQRANYFKIYLTNPSMRSALFNLVDDGEEVMGQIVETAIYAHWFHTNETLYYARWNGGEVDIVMLGDNQKAAWAIESKWSDRYINNLKELKNVVSFCHAQNLASAMVTSKTIQDSKTYKNVTINFTPASLYCYMLGYNVIHRRSYFEGLQQKK